MSTQAGTIGAPSRPVGFMLWGAIVSVLAAAALIMSAVALTQSARTSSRKVASVAPLWDTGKLEAMRGRVLAETVGVEGMATLWDTGKLEAMRGRVHAETVGVEGMATLWDAGKLEAMRGRAVAG